MGKELMIPLIQKLHFNSESMSLFTAGFYFVFHEKLSEKVFFLAERSIVNCRLPNRAICCLWGRVSRRTALVQEDHQTRIVGNDHVS